jgi:hypothetical protein
VLDVDAVGEDVFDDGFAGETGDVERDLGGHGVGAAFFLGLLDALSELGRGHPADDQLLLHLDVLFGDGVGECGLQVDLIILKCYPRPTTSRWKMMKLISSSSLGPSSQMCKVDSKSLPIMK